MYHLQLENPKRGDWASSVKKNLEDLNINFSNEEIKYIYKGLVKKCKEKALEYLISKRGKKGQDIKYKSLKMAEYLLPNEQLSIEDKRNIFEIRNMMTNIPSNFITGKNMKMKQRETFQEILDCDPPLSYILDDGNG